LAQFFQKKPLYTLHQVFFLITKIILFVTGVQKFVERKTLHPILVRIEALYTLHASFFFFGCRCSPKIGQKKNIAPNIGKN
jgi:hypothetical protein